MEERIVRIWKIRKTAVISIPKELREETTWANPGEYVRIRLDKRRNRIIIEPIKREGL